MAYKQTRIQTWTLMFFQGLKKFDHFASFRFCQKPTFCFQRAWTHFNFVCKFLPTGCSFFSGWNCFTSIKLVLRVLHSYLLLLFYPILFKRDFCICLRVLWPDKDFIKFVGFYLSRSYGSYCSTNVQLSSCVANVERSTFTKSGSFDMRDHAGSIFSSFAMLPLSTIFNTTSGKR